MKISLLYILFTLILINSYAQNINTLKERKGETLKQIDYTSKLIGKNQKLVHELVNNIALIEHQITLREQLITDLKTEIINLTMSINNNEQNISELVSELTLMKEKYAQMIQLAHKYQAGNDQLLFIMSSENFNQAYQRMLYLRQLAQYRRQKATQIDSLKATIISENESLIINRSEKDSLYIEQLDEKTKLKQELDLKDENYKYLLNRKSELQKDLKEKQKSVTQLDNKIKKLIEEKAKASKGKNDNPKNQQLTNTFLDMKGKLPWPTTEGIITDKFGEHKHPVMKYITIRNSGVDITTKVGADAHAVYQGTVSKIFVVQPGKYAVILRHGSYLTVYSNLSEVYVHTGQDVNQYTKLGVITHHSTFNSKLNFQIWNQSTKLNPELWIKKR